MTATRDAQEYIAFQRLVNALAEASAAAKDISVFRSDTKNAWLKVSETLRVTREMAFRLAGEGIVGRG